LYEARFLRAIAERQQAEYDRVYLWALGKFGPGWLPSGRHFLLDKAEEDRYRRTGEPPIVLATVDTVRREGGAKRHFIVEGRKASAAMRRRSVTARRRPGTTRISRTFSAGKCQFLKHDSPNQCARSVSWSSSR
jgi:hypothetical protein